MKSWIIFVLLSQSIWAVCSMIDKNVISKGHIKNPLVYITLNGLSNFWIFFLLPFFDFGHLGIKGILAALASSITAYAGVALYYKAVNYDEISRIVMLNQFTPVFVILLSFFTIGEMLSGYQLAGFLMLIGAGIAVSYHKYRSSFRLSKSFYYMLLSTFLIAIAYITAKYVFSEVSFWGGVLLLRVTGFIPLALLFAPSIRKEFITAFRKMKLRIKGMLGFKIAVDGIASILSDFAIFLGPVSLVSALSNATMPLLVFALALLSSIYLPKFVSEDLSRTNILIKLLALAMLMAGIVFISF